MSDEKEKRVVVDTVEKLGKPVYLDESTWNDKIIREHPYMAGMEKTVKKTLESPDNIYKDSEFSSTHNYYREHNSVKLKPFGKHLKVSVNIDLGRVKTAFTVNKYGIEGELIYTKDES